MQLMVGDVVVIDHPFQSRPCSDKLKAHDEMWMPIVGQWVLFEIQNFVIRMASGQCFLGKHHHQCLYHGRFDEYLGQ